MIIKGKSRAGARGLGQYLSHEGKNERVETIEVRGTIDQTPAGAIQEMDAYAAGTRCEKPLYHAMINPEPPHHLTPEQRLEAVDALEQKLGLDGHARVVVMHQKEGREHLHVVWSRIDLEQMRSVSDSHNYRKHEEVARDLERRFGHERVQGAHAEREGIERPDRTPSRAERQQEQKTGITGKQVKVEVTAAYKASDNALAFNSALEDKGYLLAQGDRRDFVIVDRAGGIHSLARRLEGMKAAELRDYMAPIDRETLPDVEQARAIAEERRQRFPEIKAKEDRAAEIARMEKDFSHGDDYVSQSRAAQKEFERRQDKIDNSMLPKAPEVRPTEPELRSDEPGIIIDHPGRNADEDLDRFLMDEDDRYWDQDRDDEHDRDWDHDSDRGRGPEPPPSSREEPLDLGSVEITEGMQRMLDRIEEKYGLDHTATPGDSPGQQREAPGGGRTRSR